MEQGSRYVGLDVHQETIAVAVADSGEAAPRFVGTIPNHPAAWFKLVQRLGPAARLRVCYEAGPSGYGLYRQLARWGVACVVVAPSLIPTRPGERVKTDRRDALKLARLLRSGDLTAVWVPDAAHEALRDLARARESPKRDLQRARQRLLKLLVRLEQAPAGGVRRWTRRYRAWLSGLEVAQPLQQLVLEAAREAVEQAEQRLGRLTAQLQGVAQASPWAPLLGALQCLRGVGVITAVTLVAELGDLTRFPRARQLMGYSGLTPREHSSGGRQRRGAISKAGNAHVRFVSVEAAWHYRHGPRPSASLAQRRRDQPAAVVALAEQAETRLSRRYRHLVGRGKLPQQAVVAVGRELLGFVWAIAQQVAAEQTRSGGQADSAAGPRTAFGA